MAEATIAAGFAKAFVDFAVSKGASRQGLLDRSRIHPEQFTDPDNRVSLAHYIELLKVGIDLCKQPALALWFGEEVRLPDISLLGVLGRGESAEDALLQANRYSRLAVDDGDVQNSPSIEFVREEANVWLKFNSALYSEHPLLTESGFARCVSSRGANSKEGYCHWPCPKAFSFTYPEPSYRAEYDRVFGVPLFFSSDKNAILFGEELMSVRLPPMNPHVKRLVTKEAETLLARLESSKSIRGRVESQLLPMLHTGEARVETIAAKLGVSRQTLFRKLKAEGVTFEQVLDELRRKLAVQYLKDKKTSVNETAYLLGFSDAAAFSRAFKRWTGSSPRKSTDRTIKV